MGTTYTGLKVQDTYNAIIKIGDNSELTSTAKLLSDGFGNNSPIYLSSTKLGIGVTPTFQFQTSSNAKIGGDLTVGGNLTVIGTTTQVDSTIVEIGDNMIELAKDNVANTMDIGWYGTIVSSGTKYVGVFYDASSGVATPEFHIGLGVTEPSSTASWTTKGKLVIGAIDSTGGTFSGQITIPETPTADGHAASKKYVDDSIEGADTSRRITITVKNTETVALSAGTVVHAEPTASPPSGNVIQVKKADYDTASLMPSIGILNENLDAAGGTNDEGEAIMFGFLNGIDTSSFSAGDELYVGNDGALTNTKPTATTQLIQKIAVVMKVDSTNGSIEVFGAGRSNDVPNLIDRDITFSEQVIIAQDDASDRILFTRSGHDSYSLNLLGSQGLGIYNATDDRTEMQFGGDGNIFIGDNTGTRRIILFGANSQTTSSELIFGDSSSVAAPEHAGIGLRYDSQNNQLSIRSFFDSASSSARDTPIVVFERQDLAAQFYGHVRILDNKLLLMGSGDKFQIGHKATYSQIATYEGHLYIDNNDADQDIIFRSDDGSGGLVEYFKLDGGLVNGTSTLGAVNFPDKSKIFMGTGSDFRIYHNGTDSTLENVTGDLYIQNYADDKDIIFQSDNGSGGVTTYMSLDGSATRVNFFANTRHSDNVKALFGGGGDLEIYHDENNSFIRETGTGSLYIDGETSISLRKYTGAENMLVANTDGSVELYYDASKRFETINSGAIIYNNLGLNGATPAYTIDTGETTVGTLRMVGEDDHTFIRLGAGGGSNDVTLIRVDGESSSHDGETDLGAYGFSLKYLGGLGANENALSLYADNQTATSQVESFRVKQDGTLHIAQNIFVGQSNSTDNYLQVFHSDNAYTKIHGFGIITDRTSYYFRPANDGTQTLYLGSADATRDWNSVQVKFATDVDFVQNGTNRLTINSTGINVDGIGVFSGDVTVNGGDLTVTSASTNSVINLNGGISFIEKDSGTDLYIANNVSDRDINFRVKDNGTNVIALTLDGSENGNATFSGNIYGNLIELQGYGFKGGEGDLLDSSTFGKSGIGNTFRWVEQNSSTTGSTWRKVCDVTLNTTFFDGVQMEVVVWQPDTNWGRSASLIKNYYSVAFRGSQSDVGPFFEDAIVYGINADLLRVYKVSTNNYELQARSSDDNRDLVVEYTITSKNNAKVTPNDSYTAATTSGGTAYTASANSNTKTKFAGELEFQGTTIGDDLRVNGNLFFGEDADTTYGGYLSKQSSTSHAISMKVKDDEGGFNIYQVWGNGGEASLSFEAVDEAIKLYYAGSEKLETTSSGIDVTGIGSFDNTVIISGTDTGNPEAADGTLRLSAYGVQGHRGALYLTNAETGSSATVQIGIGGNHNSNPKLVVSPTASTFYTDVQPQADSTYDLGTTSLRWANVYADNLYGIVDKLEITSNDTFNGTYSLLWHDGANNVFSSTFMTINGTTDTFSVPNISTTGDVTVGGDISAVGGSFTDPVTIYDSSLSENPRLSVGRSSAQALEFDVADTVGTIRHKQDADGNAAHFLDFTIDSSSTGNKQFRFIGIETSSETYLTIDSSGATFNGNIDFGTNGSDISMKDSAGVLTRVLVLNSSNVTYIGPVDSYAGGSSIYGASSNHGNHDLYVGGTRVLRVQSSGIDVDGTGVFENSVTIDAPDEGSAPAMTAVLNMRGYEGRGVGIKIRDSQNSASNPSAREWFIGSGYAQSGFNIGYASDGSQSSYAAQAKLSIGTSGLVTIDYKLTVEGALSNEDSIKINNGRLQLGPHNSGAGVWFDRTSDDRYWFIGLDDADSTTLRFWRGSNKAELDASGNVSFDGYVNAGTGFRTASGQAIDFVDSNIGYNSIKRDTTNGGLVFNTGGAASLNIFDNSNATFAGDIKIEKTDPTITLLDSSGANTDPNGTIIFSEASGVQNFDINYNGASDRLEFRGLVGSTANTDLAWINRNLTTTLQVFGGATFAGSIGINTTSPDEEFSVIGSAGLYGTVSSGIISPASLTFYTSEDSAGLSSSNKQKSGEIIWYGKDSSLNATGEYASIESYIIDSNNNIQGSANEGGQIEFNIWRHDVATDPRVKYTALTIDNSANAIFSGGSVGINTASPDADAKLHVSGPTTSPDLNATTPQDYTAVFSNSDIAYGTLFAVRGNGDGLIQQRRLNTTTYYHLNLQPFGNNSSRLGIGTVSPASKLHLVYPDGSYGAASTSGFINEASSGRATMRLRSATDNPAELFFDVNGAIRWDISCRNGSSPNLQFYPQAATPSLTGVSAHTFELQQDGDVVVTGNGSSGYFRAVNADFSGNVTIGNDGDISMDSSANGQLMIDGSGYQGAIALDGSAMYVYHNSSSRNLVLGTNETARLTISGSTGQATFHTSPVTIEGTNAYLYVHGSGESGWNIYAPNDAFAHMDVRTADTDSALPHKYIRNSANDGYRPYYENWYSGSAYVKFGAVGTNWRFFNPITMQDGNDIKLFHSSATSGGKIHIPRAGAITFYGDESLRHSIQSRNNSGSEADDLRINSYGAVYINLDSNNNNTSGADFMIGKHGDSTGIISTEYFRINGENGNCTIEGDLTVNGSVNFGSNEFDTIVTGDGFTDQNTQADASNIPSTTTGNQFLRVEHPSYTDGRYTTEFAKCDRGGNLPIYIRQSKGSINSFSNIIRFGDHSYNSEMFEVFGDAKVAGLKVNDHALDVDGNGDLEISAGSGDGILVISNDFISLKSGGNNERMTIDSNGRVGINDVSPSHQLDVYSTDYYAGAFDYAGTSGTLATMKFRLSGGSTSPSFVDFIYGTNLVGAIVTSGSGTTYLTSSDYRLKENAIELTGALDRLDNLQPKRFNFIATPNETVDGFMAHEVADIVPEAVRGTKDAVDENGDIIPQGIDHSKLVPLLVAAVKELKAEVESLRNQINS